MKVIYWNRTKRKNKFAQASLKGLIRKSDFIFNCLESNDETKGILDKEHLQLMKRDGYFISVVGGAGFGVEDDDFLFKMVREGRIAGFSVENEHKEGYRLPRIGGNTYIPGTYAYYTKEAEERALNMWLDVIKSAAIGRPINVVK